jgi:hypothetical protein
MIQVVPGPIRASRSWQGSEICRVEAKVGFMRLK